MKPVISRTEQRVKEYGWLGLLQMASNKACGLPRTMVAYPSKLGHAVKMRLGTSDTMVFGSVIVDEEYAFGLPASARVIVDAGANIGLTAIFYAKRFPNARVFAIEPERLTFNSCSRTSALTATLLLSTAPCGVMRGGSRSAARFPGHLESGASLCPERVEIFRRSRFCH